MVGRGAQNRYPCRIVARNSLMSTDDSLLATKRSLIAFTGNCRGNRCSTVTFLGEFSLSHSEFRNFPCKIPC
jgi:hypothetical protein